MIINKSISSKMTLTGHWDTLKTTIKKANQTLKEFMYSNKAFKYNHLLETLYYKQIALEVFINKNMYSKNTLVVLSIEDTIFKLKDWRYANIQHADYCEEICFDEYIEFMKLICLCNSTIRMITLLTFK